MKTILYIEEKPHVRENFIRMINGIGFFKVLASSTVFEAVEVMEKIKVDLVIVGRQIATKEIDILDRYLRQHRAIKIILIAEKKSQLASILKAFEYKIHFETPLDVNLLLETMLSEFGINYGGQIRGISIASFLQMIELEGKTCGVKVTHAGKVGYLYCESGNLIDAEIGDLDGKEAAFLILGLENALIEIDYDLKTENRTIKAPLMRLLLESGRIKDETPPKPKENRRYKRFSCSLPIKFFEGDWSHDGTITDISLSGIFLETKGPFAVGKEIQVALFSPTLAKGCRMSGVIVRRVPEGVGVEFLPANINQLAVLRTIIHEVQPAKQE
jgi:hypothetical protein